MKGLRGFGLVMALAFCLLLAAFGGAAQARGFSDVAPEDWFATAVDALSNAGVVDGYGDGSFHPYETVTRAQFASMLARAINPPQAWTSPFADIVQADWYYGSVASLYNVGLVAGLTSTSFAPDRGIERAQVATMIMRALTYRLGEVPQPGIVLTMSDPEAEAWLGAFRDRWFIAAPHDVNVASAVRLGIVTGQDDGRYYPLFTVTRAQAAGIIYRALYTSLTMSVPLPPSVPAEDGYDYLSMGSQGPLVTMLEQRLAALKYQVGTVDGYFDERTESGLIAFQKAEGLQRTGECGVRGLVPHRGRASGHTTVPSPWWAGGDRSHPADTHPPGWGHGPQGPALLHRHAGLGHSSGELQHPVEDQCVAAKHPWIPLQTVLLLRRHGHPRRLHGAGVAQQSRVRADPHLGDRRHLLAAAGGHAGGHLLLASVAADLPAGGPRVIMTRSTGRLAQGESASLTRKRPQVQIL